MTFYLPPSLPGNKCRASHLANFHTCCSILSYNCLQYLSQDIRIICITLIHVYTTLDIHRPPRYIGVPFFLLPRSAMMRDSRPCEATVYGVIWGIHCAWWRTHKNIPTHQIATTLVFTPILLWLASTRSMDNLSLRVMVNYTSIWKLFLKLEGWRFNRHGVAKSFIDGIPGKHWMNLLQKGYA